MGDRGTDQIAGPGVAERPGRGSAQSRGDQHGDAAEMFRRRRRQLPGGADLGQESGPVHPQPRREGQRAVDQRAMIGVFDSGFGGLTVLDSLLKALPQYDYLFLADSARAPYGARSLDVIYEFTLESVEWLFDEGCTLVILACNTASTRALRNLQQLHLPCHRPDRRVLGVVRPSVEALAGLAPGAVPGRTPPSSATGV